MPGIAQVCPTAGPVRAIGSYLPTDADGYLVNDCDAANIPPRLAELVTAFYARHYGTALLSVYVRGSVARGSAVAGVSDLDTFAVVDDACESACPLLPAGLIARLKDAAPGLIDYEFHAWKRSSVVGNYYSPRAFLVKTQAVCISGLDLAPELKPYRAGPELMAEAMYIRQRLAQYRQRLASDGDAGQRMATCQWMMKALVRAAFDLTLDKLGRYTRDLYLCHQAFAQLYPAQASDSMQALEWAVAPILETQAQSALSERFGDWIALEAERLIRQHNIDRSKYAF